ncbi:hypothetical protein HJFPF1_09356 [Paramyrothecium foliicola]|nr:hypothetical protein HJFPF1_09356 [Paramyrothecium foliicola]
MDAWSREPLRVVRIRNAGKNLGMEAGLHSTGYADASDRILAFVLSPSRLKTKPSVGNCAEPESSKLPIGTQPVVGHKAAHELFHLRFAYTHVIVECSPSKV